ncbi:MAG: OsmC family protein [Chloroflexi bacterium]|nr:OsmC family protein [Chloroflexota bacterium]
MNAKMPNINKGIDVGPLQDFKEEVREDFTNADRNPTVLAEWIGGDQSKISMDGIETYLGGEGYLNPMKMLLACFAACDVDVIAMHASFLGLKIENLSIEASGHFNVQSYLGLENTPGSGYDDIAYTIRLDAPDATQEQIDYLIERCELSSPVGDTLGRAVPMKLEFVANP